jgi:hypothetical protein
MSALDVEAVAKTLTSATSFLPLFGKLDGSDIKTNRRSIRKQFAYLAQIVHPDHVPDAPALAEKTFEHLRALFNAADDAITDGTYDKPFSAGHKHGSKIIGEDSFELQSKTSIYRCANTPYRTGDFSVLYRAQINKNDVLVKIASDPTANPLLETEGARLKRFRTLPIMKGIVSFIPELLDSFVIRGPDRRQYRANVMGYKPGVLSLTDIVAAFPGGLVPQHASWIARRVIAQTVAASMAGLVHGSITPDHVLVDPIKHEPLHIGWLHSVEATRLTMIVDRWKDWYPPEVFEKKVPTHKTDIYMAAKTCIWLFSRTNPPSLPSTISPDITRVLMSCVEQDPDRRPVDGLAVLNHLTTAIWSAWDRSYRPLMMPV